MQDGLKRRAKHADVYPITKKKRYPYNTGIYLAAYSNIKARKF